MRNSASRSARDLYDFAWQVSLGGYQWITVEEVRSPRTGRGRGDKELRRLQDEEHRILTDARPAGGGNWPVRRYSPLHHEPTLYRLFAETELSEAGVSNFARRYGSLLGFTSLLMRLSDSKKDLVHGESLALWKREIRTMAEMTKLHELVARKATAELHELVRWSELTSVTYTSAVSSDGYQTRAVILSPRIHRELKEILRYPGILMPAKEYMRRVVSEKVSEMTTMKLLWDTDFKGMQLYATPQHLLGALWLQCARALELNQDYRQCPGCENWFPVGLGVGRSDKKTCSPKCRVRGSRRASTSAAARRTLSKPRATRTGQPRSK